MPYELADDAAVSFVPAGELVDDAAVSIVAAGSGDVVGCFSGFVDFRGAANEPPLFLVVREIIARKK